MNVPQLDLYQIPKYNSDSSSSSSEELDSKGKPKRGPNPRQLKRVLDKYNIHTCARNLKEQQKQSKKRREEERIESFI